jgi:hypothetical protein
VCVCEREIERRRERVRLREIERGESIREMKSERAGDRGREKEEG